MKSFEEFVNESYDYDMKSIKVFVRKNSYFDFDQKDNNELIFSTRDNGNVGTEEAGRKDIIAGEKLAKEIKNNFNVEVTVETVDEWVLVIVKKSDSREAQIDLAFQKSSVRDPESLRGSGFTEPVKSERELFDIIERMLGREYVKKAQQNIDNIELNIKGHNRMTGYFLLTEPSDGNEIDAYYFIKKNKRTN